MHRGLYTDSDTGRIMELFDSFPKVIRQALTQANNYNTIFRVKEELRKGKKEKYILKLIKEGKAKQELGQKSELTSEITFEDL